MATTTTTTTFQVPTSDHSLTELAEELAFALAFNGGFTWLPTGSPVGSFVQPVGPDVDSFTAEVAPLTGEPGALTKKFRYVCGVANLEELRFDVASAVITDGASDATDCGVADWVKFQDLVALLRANLLRTKQWVETNGTPGVSYGYGLWDDEGSVCFDVVALFRTKKDAMAQAVALNERAIFDLAKCEDVENPDYVADTSDDEKSEGLTQAQKAEAYFYGSSNIAPIDNDRVVQGQVGVIG